MVAANVALIITGAFFNFLSEFTRMPSKSRKSDYAILVVLALLTCVCLLGLFAWGALRTDSDQPKVRTTHSSEAEGTMAADILFERFGHTLTAHEAPLLDDTLAEVDVLWIIEPSISLNSIEITAVENWVRDGGVLISTGLPREMFMGKRSCYQCSTCCPSSSDKSSKTLHNANSIPDTADHLALARGVAQLQWATDTTLNTMVETEEKYQPLLRDSAGVRIAERNFGQGSVILLADSSFLANGMIGKRDNAVLALNLSRYALAQADDEIMVYDEYHLGYGHYESGFTALSKMMLTTSPGWAVLSLTVAGVLYLLYKGRRFGTRREPGRVRRRSKMEFVQAVGASFRSSGAHRLTWRLIYQAWKRRASRELGLPVGVSVDQLSKLLAQRSGGSAEACQEILNACEQATKRGRLSARKVTNLAENLARVERETLNGNPERKRNG